ncbi:MAG: hypothetical protein ABSA08_02090 [Acidimicrobiales bacterium]
MGFPFRELAVERGVLAPDRVLPISTFTGDASDLDLVPPGVTEVRAAPALDTPELRASAVDWQARITDATLLESQGALSRLDETNGLATIGYRSLRQLMR